MTTEITWSKLIQLCKKYAVFSSLAFGVVSFSAFVNVSGYQEIRLKDTVTIDYQAKKIETLGSKVEYCNKRLSVLISNEKKFATWIDEFNTPAWIKELDLKSDVYKVVYINEAYESFLPKGMVYYDLLGKSGKLLDIEFGKEYQKNDRRAARSKDPILVLEPYRLNGVGKIRYGWFVKGRIWSIKSKVVVFGLLAQGDLEQAVEEFKRQVDILEQKLIKNEGKD